jgi:hypothetical protein
MTKPSADPASLRMFHGSCACGRVRFEVDLDLSRGTEKCNCTACWKRRAWNVRAETAAFRATSGVDELTQPRAGVTSGPGGFCRHCGVRVYSFVDAADWNDGAYVSVNVAALDDLEPAALVAAPVRYFDGRANNWWSTPAETRHL